MKKLTPFVLLFCVFKASTAFAILPEKIFYDVVAPDLKSGFNVILEGNYLRPYDSGLQYSTVNRANNLTQTSLIPDYNFGFKIGVGFVPNHSSRDIQFMWSHFDHATTQYAAAVNGGSGVSLTTALGNTLPVDSQTQTISPNSKANFKQEVIDLNVGQNFDLGSRLSVRLLGGFRYLYFENDVWNTYVSTDMAVVNNNYTTTEERDAYFSGIGPRIGVSTHTDLGNRFGFVTGFAAGILSGNGRMVTDLEGKLALDCLVPFAKGAYPMLVEAGYEATNYTGITQRTSTYGQSTTHAGLSGPYVSLNLKM